MRSWVATYLITGIAGFIGSHLAHALVERGDHVRGFDNFSTGQRANLAGIEQHIDMITGDLADADAIARACLGVDCIFHQGALPSVPRSVKDPRSSHNANINGTFNLLEGARAAGVRRIVYAGSSSAYGNQPGFPRVETMPAQPIAPYAVQKRTGELYMQSYWNVYRMETVILRYFNIFGPRQAPNSPYSGVIAKFCAQMLRGEQPTLQGDGEQARDFTYIQNAVNANLAAMAAPAGHVAGRIFNIACGQAHSLNELYAILATLTGYTGAPAHTDPRAGDVHKSLADISAAHDAFGYTPAVSFAEGLAKTVDWYRTTL